MDYIIVYTYTLVGDVKLKTYTRLLAPLYKEFNVRGNIGMDNPRTQLTITAQGKQHLVNGFTKKVSELDAFSQPLIHKFAGHIGRSKEGHKNLFLLSTKVVVRMNCCKRHSVDVKNTE